MMHWVSLASGLLIGLGIGWVWRPWRRREPYIGRNHGSVHIHYHDDDQEDNDV